MGGNGRGRGRKRRKGEGDRREGKEGKGCFMALGGWTPL